MDNSSLFEPGWNCWRVERATRVSWLIDGAAYFAAFRSAVAQARHSVFVLAWDIDSRLRLVRDETPPDDGLPVDLAEFLEAVVERRPGLDVRLLPWDYNPIYLMEREWRPRFSANVELRLDDQHPIGGSQHQKVVVIDDRVAFVGGLDLGSRRWDTSDHSIEDDRRRDPAGESYPPFHDVQMLVEGPVAAALGEMARERWRQAGGGKTDRNQDEAGGDPPWPTQVAPLLRNVPIAIARTVPAFGDRAEVREVEQLHLDVIERAERFLYIENQYLSCRTVGQALERRLAEAEGPEVVLVLPRKTGGWLEQHTMDVLRTGLLEKLRDADRYGRLRVCCPVVYGDDDGKQRTDVGVHTKLVIADDRVLRIGSANLSNRSMGLDSECDLALEAAGDETAVTAIRRLRTDLLAEHLGLTPEDAHARLGDPESLVAAIDAQRNAARTLECLDVKFDSDLDRQLAESSWLDPKRPIEPEPWIRNNLPERQQTGARRRILGWACVVGSLVLLASLWRWGPLGDVLDREALLRAFDLLERNPLAPFGIVGLITVLGSVGVPINLLLVAAALSFGPWLGFAYTLGGAWLSAMVSFGVGRYAGLKFLRRLAGRKLNELSRRLAERGLLAVVVLRLVPVAPFSVVNVAAGASHVSWRNFAVGTLIGISAPLLAVALLTDRLKAAIEAPDVTTWLALAAVSFVALAGVLLVRRWLRRRGRRSPEGGRTPEDREARGHDGR